MSASNTLSLSLEEILPGGSVRFTDDGMLYAVELVMVITGKNRDDSGMVLRRLTKAIFNLAKLTDRNTGGRGNSKTKLISFTNALELIMVLPGKMARETRTKFADLIKRYLAGDSTLVRELAENSDSTHPIHGLARQSLAAQEGAVQDDESRKRRRIMEELNIQKQTMEVEASRAQTKLMLMQTYQSLCPGQVMDDAARVMFKDQFLNMAMGDYGQRKRLTSSASTAEGSSQAGDDHVYDENKPITVSTVASEMGLVLKSADAQRIGVSLKKMYFTRYQREPTKHEQMVGGAMRNVNSYAERDKDMMKEAITNHFK